MDSSSVVVVVEDVASLEKNCEKLLKECVFFKLYGDIDGDELVLEALEGDDAGDDDDDS